MSSPRSLRLSPLPEAVQSLLPPPASSDTLPPPSRLYAFMGARLGVATLLLGGTLLITLRGDRDFDGFTPRFLVSLIAAIYGATLVFAVWMLGAVRRERLGLAQVGTDLVVTTGLVYVTGGPSSGFTFLYGVAVLMAAMVVGPLAAIMTGVSAMLLYGTVVLGLSLGWVHAPPDQVPDAYYLSVEQLSYVGLLNVLGLLLVTMLAANLAGRLITTGGRLRAAEASAATLARLNDDIVRSLSSGVISTDGEGRIRTVNPAGVEILGLTAERLVGRPVAGVLDVDVSGLLDSKPPRSGAYRAETNAMRKSGEQFPVGYSMNALLDSSGQPLGALILFQDLSEIQQLRESAARADRLTALGKLSAGLAHEIRNPLGSISGSVQLVRESSRLDAEEQRLLGIVQDEVERLSELVSTMLQVGRPQAPRPTETDLRPIVEIVTEMAEVGLTHAKEVRIRRSLPDGPVPAYVDEGQIRQVLWNLIKNAIQASPVRATVHVSARSNPDGSAVLEVADEGPGVPAAQQARVYDMFYSERTHGTGLGLAVVRQIVDAHGGHIEITSGDPHGATFTLTFPRERSALRSPSTQSA